MTVTEEIVEEQLLIRQCLANDSADWDRLYEHYQPGLLRSIWAPTQGTHPLGRQRSLFPRRQAHPVRQRRQDVAAVGRGQRQGAAPVQGTHRVGRVRGLLAGRPPRPLGGHGRDGAPMGRGHRPGTVPLRGPPARSLGGSLFPGRPSRPDRRHRQDLPAVVLAVTEKGTASVRGSSRKSRHKVRMPCKIVRHFAELVTGASRTCRLTLEAAKHSGR